MEKVELKPCPFCGSEAELITDRANMSVVRCSNFSCWISTKTSGFKETVINKWNTRADQLKEVPGE